MSIRQALTLSSTLFFLFTSLLSLSANAQTVVSRAKVGGYAEDITYVTSGTLKDQLVMAN